ncbi:MAG: DEAD/DEAH box helicase family protein [Synergistaceae bacterium]|jgi:type III restriction enzyme|nr:DEAD/DEAH box helicase family protein [Synergistaceae bacterium]
MSADKSLIINSAFSEPEFHWKHESDDLDLSKSKKESGRRPAGYVVRPRPNEQGKFVELKLVNEIRPLVKAWREGGFEGVTPVTRKLLEHWHDDSRGEAGQRRFFWCQLDAIETLVWLSETLQGRAAATGIPGDGGLFTRLCTKLCTGGGKTIVMAMLIAWQVCNKVVNPRDERFSKDVLIVAPGLTVKNRLQTLRPGGGSCYEDFGVVPCGYEEMLARGNVVITNWQALAWDSEEDIKKRKSVDKRGPKRDEAYARDVLGSGARGILVINDEAHHAWRRMPDETKARTREEKEAEKEATVWIGGLDRIHVARGIKACYDFSATPMPPFARDDGKDTVYPWTVSDFGLSDGIEAGLVKTPRMVVRDDAIPNAKTMKSKFYHIYAEEEVKENLNNRGAIPETDLPSLLTMAYKFLGRDWLETFKAWRKADAGGNDDDFVPPVMITVANRTESAARVKYAFDHGRIGVPELCNSDTVHIDSDSLEKAGKEAAALREKVDTVGQRGKPGQYVRNVISVGMLSEGWNANNVTHIMGIRAFSGQLLCEQVVGRGLRRRSYDTDEHGMYTPEYVNVFGIPFDFLPCPIIGGTPQTPKPTTCIAPDDRKRQYEITFPDVIRVERTFKPTLTLDASKIDEITLEADKTPLRADLASLVNGKPDLSRCNVIDMQKLEANLRMQRLVFEAAARVYEEAQYSWKDKATRFALLGQVIHLVEDYLTRGAGSVNIVPALFNQDPLRRRLMIMMNMNSLVSHLLSFIRLEATENPVPIFAPGKRTRSTGDMKAWYTSKPTEYTQKSHINHCVVDSALEAAAVDKLDNNSNVAAWVKNDHLGFEITYIAPDGLTRKYYPDFIVKLTNGRHLVLEMKGEKSPESEAKRKALEEWVEAVNGSGDAHWCCGTAYKAAEVDGIVENFAS